MFTRLWWNTFITGNYHRLRPLDLSASLPRGFHLLSWGEKQVRIPMDTTNRSNLALGRPNMCFVLSFVNDGFCLGSTSMEHDFVNYDSKFNFFPPSKKKKDILIELWRNMPPSENYIEIDFSSIVSIQFLYHLIIFVTLFSLSLSLSLN